LRLEEVLDTPLDDRVKGIPGGTPTFSLRDLGSFGWNVLDEDLPLPLLVLKGDALRDNVDLMSRYCERHGVEHAPHGKTTMAPQIFEAQLDAGCWGITAATVEQLQVYRRVGVSRVLFANQLIGRPHIEYVARQLLADPTFELVSWVDSPAGVSALSGVSHELRLDRPFDVCLEVGYSGGRTGARDLEQVDEVARAVEASKGAVRLVGVSAFEGALAQDRSNDTGVEQGRLTARAFLASVVEVSRRLERRGLLSDRWMLTAGGSTAFDEVVDVFGEAGAPRVILRSGCYVTHDHGAYAAASPLSSGATVDATELGALSPALELWTYVQSTPEQGLAILGCGRRDVPDDYGYPVPLARWPDGSRIPQPLAGQVVTLNDQHCFLRHDAQLDVGDRVTLGLSHPCRAFDKWRVVFVVDDDYTVSGGVLTYF
jgi:D-serine dehydratase